MTFSALRSVAKFNVTRVKARIARTPAIMNIPDVNATAPSIIGPTNPPNAANELTTAIPTGAVDFQQRNDEES